MKKTSAITLCYIKIFCVINVWRFFGVNIGSFSTPFVMMMMFLVSPLHLDYLNVSTICKKKKSILY